ncbi:smad nuclear-interacting protein 1-like [Babylonia areolata]|uniref:smad nuclear-interacting protein 1-like n=1 Tax=Babylonia areolata TaxID=304850 RepID=UPI003FD259DF
MPMVKQERDRSRSPVSKDRRKREREHSPVDRTHQHRQQHRDRESRRARDSRSKSPSPDMQRPRQRSHRHTQRNRNEHREESGNQRERRTRFDPDRRIKQEPTDSQDHQRERQRNDDRRREARQQRDAENGGDNFGQSSATEGEASEKEKPNFELSGKLTEDTNTYRGVVIKYNEPPEARKPKRRWRLYGFKGDESLPMLPIHRQSAFLLGRDRRVADIPVDHPSCSKQHAVLQYRLTEYSRPDGTVGRKVRPYIIDLGSANGTYVNNQRIDAQRYVELFERDLIKFGFSTREYVLLHENVDTSEVAQDSDTE